MNNIGYYKSPFQRAQTEEKERGPIIAYDLETDNIPDVRNSEGGSVNPRYFTAFGSNIRMAFPVGSYDALAITLDALFCVAPDTSRIVAWNANRFDVRLVLASLVEKFPHYVVKPFVAKGNQLRGCVIENGTKSLYFLDGVNMTGITKTKLGKFLQHFAPEYAKLELDFKKTSFDPTNPEHVAYAIRDSEGLYYGLQLAEKTMKKLTGRGLQVTIGNAGIKAFARNIPKGVKIYATNDVADAMIRKIFVRGGYVYCAKAYDGPAYSYDINQAYAASMRETWLPAGRCVHTSFEVSRKYPALYVADISREERAPAPFYVRNMEGEAVECFGEVTRCGLTSNEVACLRRHGWNVRVQNGWYWTQRFHMTQFVNRLERLRMQYAGGTPINIMCKGIGNNSYGKTLEVVPPFSYYLTQNPPDGCSAADIQIDDDGEAWGGYIWMKPEDRDTRRAYHRPFLGAFITAGVRVKLYDAIMLDPEHFLKADTDSVTFSRPVPLPLDPGKYGLWKQESDGDRHIIIGKKVYMRLGDDPVKVCKGLHTDMLTLKHYQRWLRTGEPPEQEQMQLQSWRNKGFAPLYVKRRRKGTDFRKKRT